MDPEATGAAIGEAVSQADGASGTVSAAAVVTEKQPEITTEELSSIKDVLGTFSTSFKTSGASRSTNLQVGAAKINGRVLMPGEVLSGYECMQPFTVANGYRAATAYENGGLWTASAAAYARYPRPFITLLCWRNWRSSRGRTIP